MFNFLYFCCLQNVLRLTIRFVHYGTQQEVDKAVSLYNDYEFNGSKLRVMSASNTGGSSSNGYSGGSSMNGSQRFVCFQRMSRLTLNFENVFLKLL